MRITKIGNKTGSRNTVWIQEVSMKKDSLSGGIGAQFPWYNLTTEENLPASIIASDQIIDNLNEESINYGLMNIVSPEAAYYYDYYYDYNIEYGYDYDNYYNYDYYNYYNYSYEYNNIYDYYYSNYDYYDYYSPE
jgi:hypothetical protein